MNSLNRLVFVSLLIVQFAYFIGTNPLPAENTPRPSEAVDEYDQRQNGSENVRIHMNDVTLVVAPSEGIMQLMSASANDFLNGSTDNVANKPSSGSSTYSATDCATENVAKCKQQTHKK